MDLETFQALIRPSLDQVFAGRPYDASLLAEILKPRVTRLNQIAEMVAFLVRRQDYPVEWFVNKKSKTDLALAARVLPEVTAALRALPVWERAALHDCLVSFAARQGLKNGQVMWPVRIALSGQEVTPGGAIEILTILGRDESLARLELALDKLKEV
jgi:glutamyl-tRNA synthetase